MVMEANKRRAEEEGASISEPGLFPDEETRSDRSERHAREVEESQHALRVNIKETERLLDESDELLRRHRKESDEAAERSAIFPNPDQ